MKRFILMSAMFLGIVGVSFAQTSPETPATPSITSILGTVNKIPGLKSGVIYDFKTNQALATNTFEVMTLKSIGADAISINAGALRSDGVAGTASVDMAKVKFAFLQFPILDLTNYLNIGYGVGIENMTFHGGYSEDPKSDNHIVYGPYASVSWKF